MDLKESALVFVSKMVKSVIYLLGRPKGDLIRVFAYCLAFSDRSGLALFYMTNTGLVPYF